MHNYFTCSTGTPVSPRCAAGGAIGARRGNEGRTGTLLKCCSVGPPPYADEQTGFPVACATPLTAEHKLGTMEAAQLELLRTDELDIALRLSFLEHCGGAAGAGSSADDKEARRKEKKKQKDLKVSACARCCALHCLVAWSVMLA